MYVEYVMYVYCLHDVVCGYVWLEVGRGECEGWAITAELARGALPPPFVAK